MDQKLIIYHGPKSGGTSLYSFLSDVFELKGKFSCDLKPEDVYNRIRNNFTHFSGRSRMKFIGSYGFEVTNDPIRPVTLKDGSLNELRLAQLVSGHIHTSRNFAGAFANTILWEYSCNNSVVDRSDRKKCTSLIVYRDAKGWLKSVLNFTYQGIVLKRLDSSQKIFKDWVQFVGLLESEPGLARIGKIRSRLVDILVDWKERGYYSSQGMNCRNMLAANEYIGANIDTFRLSTQEINSFCDRVLTEVGLPSSSRQAFVKNKTSVQNKVVTELLNECVDTLNNAEMSTLNLSLDIYERFPSALCDKDFYKALRDILA